MAITHLLFGCAIALSSVAAYYSIVGLATIFSAAFWPVVIMALTLEVSKLVCASWLYHKWNSINSLLKTYLTSSVVVLMLITSLGIFGFLTRAHTDQKLANTEITIKLDQIDRQISLINQTTDRYKAQLEQLDKSINLQLNANRATQAQAARQRQMDEREQIRIKLDDEQSKIQEFENQRASLKKQMSALESELGPIKYVAELFSTGSSVDAEKAVKWMILVLVLVFDPLAVLMLIAANMSLTKTQKTGDNNPLLFGNAQLKYDFDSKTVMFFDGFGWKSLHQVLEQTHQKSDITQSMVESLSKIEKLMLDQHSKFENSQAELIKDTVKNAMDHWLTTTANPVQSVVIDDNSKKSLENTIQTEVKTNTEVKSNNSWL